MAAVIVARNEKSFTVQVEIPYCKSMLAFEDAIQTSLNLGGVSATAEALSRFDTDGSPILMGETKFTSKGKAAKVYQSAYGQVLLERYVYQSSKGGRLFCPLERDARIVGTSTPKFAKMLAHKYADMGSLRVLKDLGENHGRAVVRSFVQNVVELVGLVAIAKEETWSYMLPDTDKAVKSISIGLDGTCMLLCDDGWRETMVGTLGYYDEDGNRLHTTYAGAIPEYGKGNFLERLAAEIARAKEKYPQARYIGLADGAHGNWEFLNEHTDTQIVDFWHAAGYLAKAAEAMFKGKVNAQAKVEWLDDARHRLKHTKGAASKLLKEMKDFSRDRNMSAEGRTQLKDSITYFKNQLSRMQYPDYVEDKLPIGSGVTEAACKVIVKQRLCNSGMKWAKPGAAVVLSLRCLSYSENRWAQFWGKIDQYGLSLAA